jgi:hypothetical protein
MGYKLQPAVGLFCWLKLDPIHIHPPGRIQGVYDRGGYVFTSKFLDTGFLDTLSFSSVINGGIIKLRANSPGTDFSYPDTRTLQFQP